MNTYILVYNVLFLQDVIEAISESAFKTSDYPVILSFENHCRYSRCYKFWLICNWFYFYLKSFENLKQFVYRLSGSAYHSILFWCNTMLTIVEPMFCKALQKRRIIKIKILTFFCSYEDYRNKKPENFCLCSPRQQAKMAQYCRQIFGEMLLDAPLDSHPVSYSLISWILIWHV